MRPRRYDEDGVPGVTLECVDCQSAFLVTEGEQDWFKAAGWDIPARCKPCRTRRRRERDAAWAQNAGGTGA